MNKESVLKELESLGTEQNRKVFKRHGVGDNFYGVSFANLNTLKKKIKTNQDLALELWDTGNVDARFPASMIADPSKFTRETAEKWISDIKFHVQVDVLVGSLLASTPYSQEIALEWINSENEYKARAGWTLISTLATKNKSMDDSFFFPLLDPIEKNIHLKPNRTREAMNGALIAIGGRSDKLEPIALEAAARIGKVEVDHGDTSCKTPDAIPYIKKMTERRHQKKK